MQPGPADDPDTIRRIINQGINDQRVSGTEYEQSFASDVGGLPLFANDAGQLGSLLSLGNALSDQSFATLNTVDQSVADFAELRAGLEQAGYIVDCVSGEEACSSDVFAEFRFVPAPAILASLSDSVSLAGTPLEAIENQSNLTGELEIAGQLVVDFGFGVDRQGFFIRADSALIAQLDVLG